MPDPAPASAPEEVPAYAAGDLRAGGFRFWFVGQRWEWSDELARMHGYEPGTVVPDHRAADVPQAPRGPAPRPGTARPRCCTVGGSFSSRHRFVDTDGVEHDVIVLADRMLDGDGAVVGTEGYYVDLTETFDKARRAALDESLPELFEARAAIEQAKGALMLVYGVDADAAFETAAVAVAADQHQIAGVGRARWWPTWTPSRSAGQSLRRQFDHLLLTVHDRVTVPATGSDGRRVRRTRTNLQVSAPPTPVVRLK